MQHDKNLQTVLKSTSRGLWSYPYFVSFYIYTRNIKHHCWKRTTYNTVDWISWRRCHTIFQIILTNLSYSLLSGCQKTIRDKCCVFPFVYQGRRIYSCIKDNHDQPWCATTDNFDRDHLWDNCQGIKVAFDWLSVLIIIIIRLSGLAVIFLFLSSFGKTSLQAFADSR